MSLRKQIRERGYSSLRSFEDKYIGWLNHVKVFIKPTNREEIEALTELQNIPGVPNMMDHFPIIHSIYTFVVVTQYIKGKTLEQITNKNTLRLSEKMSITDALLEIVDNIHREGWVHGDINLQNVIIDSNLEVFLLDYATTFKPEEEYPKKGFLYPPPESLMLKRNKYIIDPHYRVNKEYDLWTLGLVLFVLGLARFRDNIKKCYQKATFCS